MADTDATKENKEQVSEYRWADFLTSVPPGSFAKIPDLVAGYGSASVTIATPDLVLHCSSETCRGERIFAAVNKPTAQPERFGRIFLTYSCRNCTQTQRTYALLLNPKGGFDSEGISAKIGEWPPFGPPTPARVISIVGPDRDLFLKGRRSENQGLGLGAFAYYRRSVENQKMRLFEEIIRVSKKVGARPDAIRALEEASKEQQFSKSIQLARDAIPESLLIDGHNPLLLLHRALSVGLHEGEDDECLSRARSVRLVLTELAERIGHVLKDTAELKEAIGHLLTLPKNDKMGDAG